MVTSKRKRTPSTKAAAIASETGVATVATTTRKKASKQQPPPTSHQTPPTTDTTVDTVEIPSSPPVVEQVPTTEQLPPQSDRVEEFEYWVLQTAVTTSGACIWSKRAGPFNNGLCSLVTIERDILAGIQHNLGVAQWQVTLRMAWINGRKKATSESVSLDDVFEDWVNVENVLQIQLQQGVYARDIKKGVLPTIEVVFTVRKLSTPREDQDAARLRERQQRRTTSTQLTQHSQDNSLLTPTATPVPSRTSVTARREAEAPELLAAQIRAGNLSGIVARHYGCRTDGCGNENKFCLQREGVHYRLEKSQLIAWAEQVNFGVATPHEVPEHLLQQILKQRVPVDGRKTKRISSTPSTVTMTSSSPPVVNNYHFQHAWPPAALPHPLLQYPPFGAPPLPDPPRSQSTEQLQEVERFSTPPGPESAVISVRQDFFRWLEGRFSDSKWAAKVKKLGKLARQHEWDFDTLRRLSEGETRAYKIALSNGVADGILTKLNSYISRFKSSYCYNEASASTLVLGDDLGDSSS